MKTQCCIAIHSNNIHWIQVIIANTCLHTYIFTFRRTNIHTYKICSIHTYVWTAKNTWQNNRPNERSYFQALCFEWISLPLRCGHNARTHTHNTRNALENAKRRRFHTHTDMHWPHTAYREQLGQSGAENTCWGAAAWNGAQAEQFRLSFRRCWPTWRNKFRCNFHWQSYAFLSGVLLFWLTRVLLFSVCCYVFVVCGHGRMRMRVKSNKQIAGGDRGKQSARPLQQSTCVHDW